LGIWKESLKSLSKKSKVGRRREGGGIMECWSNGMLDKSLNSQR
jgi:hypothetical protein